MQFSVRVHRSDRMIAAKPNRNNFVSPAYYSLNTFRTSGVWIYEAGNEWSDRGICQREIGDGQGSD